MLFSNSWARSFCSARWAPASAEKAMSVAEEAMLGTEQPASVGLARATAGCGAGSAEVPIGLRTLDSPGQGQQARATMRHAALG